METNNFNEKEVRECYKFLNHLNETEIRIIDPTKKSNPKSIFVSCEDDFVKACKDYNGTYNIYAGINEREHFGTTKRDVISVKTIVIDIDAIRAKGFEGQPATEEELKKSEEIADNIIIDIAKSKQPLPIKVCSGNGYHLWFAIDSETITEAERSNVENKLQLFQDKIKELYDVDGKSIDKIGDLPRIGKVWGTLNIKGNNTLERPHRIVTVIGNAKREVNPILKKQIFALKEVKEQEEYPFVEIDTIQMDALPPCIQHLYNVYKNNDGNFWFRIIQLFAAFFKGIGLPKEETFKLIMQWNIIQPYHEDEEDKVIKDTVERIYRNDIKMGNCSKIKSEKGGFPYFGLANLKLCSEDNLCKGCINPLIRYKRFTLKPNEFEQGIKAFVDKRDLADRFIKLQPIYYDKGKNWWIWDYRKFKWDLIDETDILNKISIHSSANTIPSAEKNEILEALKQKGRLNKPKDAKKTWVQFKDTIVDLENGNEFKATPEYFVTNPIPWELGDTDNTEFMDKIFKEWVGEEHVKTLYEIIAYCLLPDLPIHRLFCFIGSGLNGKSTYLNLVIKFVGQDNCCSTDLDILLSSRFEVTKLFKKLVCLMGETNFAELENTSVIKRLTGNDFIRFEFKNKNPFEDYNYAKILIATNNLPVTDDKTVGFYRRWLILDFDNVFSEKMDILKDIPDSEFNNLARKSINILMELLKKKEFHNEGTIEEKTKVFEDKSNPLDKFLKEETVEDYESHIFKYELIKRLNSWCEEHRFRKMSEETIGKMMKDKGYNVEQHYADWFNADGDKPKLRAWVGIKWK